MGSLTSDSRSAREALWRWPVLVALAATVPAFYLEMLQSGPRWFAGAAYALAALVMAASAWRRGRNTTAPWWRGDKALDVLLVPGLLVAALLPASHASHAALAWRLALAAPILVRMMFALRHLVVRGGLGYLAGLALLLLCLSGLGFWWLEPNVTSFGDGLWLAFTTAATVGFGDIVPSTAASRIFAVFVVLLGYGVLSLVTAGIAALLVQSQERRIEHEILHAMHRELRELRGEVARLRAGP
jgi:voltage-gated potassium channel